MLDDRDGRLVEIAGASTGGISIDVVVVRHLLAVQLLPTRQAAGGSAGPVERCRLVWVFPIPKSGDLLPGASHPPREAGAVPENSQHAAHPARHPHDVGGCV